MSRSYISVSEGITACNSLALCGCSPSAFAPSDNPDFTGIVCAPAFSATTCVIAPRICAGICFVGSGAGLTGTAVGLSIGGGANNAVCLGGECYNRFIYGTSQAGSNIASTTYTSSETAMYKSGFWETNGASWTPSTDWYWGITAAHTSNSSAYNYSMQIAANGTGGEAYYIRRINGGTPTAWKNIWTSGDAIICASTSMCSPIVCGTTCIVTPQICTSGALTICGGGSNVINLITNGAYVLRGINSSCTSLYYNGTEALKTLSNGACIIGCGFATDFIASSDCRLKTDVQPIIGALSMVEKLQGVYYKLNDETECNVGLIAQDVLPIVPEVVGCGECYYGIKYDKLTAILIEAIKEQNVKINNLELEIERIKTC